MHKYHKHATFGNYLSFYGQRLLYLRRSSKCVVRRRNSASRRRDGRLSDGQCRDSIVRRCIAEPPEGRFVVDLNTETRYCENCGEERTVAKTMPWQDDICKSCGANVPSEEDDADEDS